jgi:hypothetical protein
LLVVVVEAQEQLEVLGRQMLEETAVLEPHRQSLVHL